MDVIAEKPAHPPGEKYAYSNVGYTIAGAMAETATGVSWEDLVKREVFNRPVIRCVGGRNARTGPLGRWKWHRPTKDRVASELKVRF